MFLSDFYGQLQWQSQILAANIITAMLAGIQNCMVFLGVASPAMDLPLAWNRWMYEVSSEAPSSVHAEVHIPEALQANASSTGGCPHGPPPNKNERLLRQKWKRGIKE